MFNNESSRRGKEFVTRKITDYVGRLQQKFEQIGTRTGKLMEAYSSEKLKLGNIESFRDWSASSDMANAQYLMLEQDKLDDYVFGSEETHSVKEFCDIAFSHVGFDYRDWIEIDPEFYRPAEVDFLKCDCTKAKTVRGWSRKVSFLDLVKNMTDADVKRYQ